MKIAHIDIKSKEKIHQKLITESFGFTQLGNTSLLCCCLFPVLGLHAFGLINLKFLVPECRWCGAEGHDQQSCYVNFVVNLVPPEGPLSEFTQGNIHRISFRRMFLTQRQSNTAFHWTAAVQWILRKVLTCFAVRNLKQQSLKFSASCCEQL